MCGQLLSLIHQFAVWQWSEINSSSLRHCVHWMALIDQFGLWQWSAINPSYLCHHVHRLLLTNQFAVWQWGTINSSYPHPQYWAWPRLHCPTCRTARSWRTTCWTMPTPRPSSAPPQRSGTRPGPSGWAISAAGRPYPPITLPPTCSSPWTGWTPWDSSPMKVSMQGSKFIPIVRWFVYDP